MFCLWINADEKPLSTKAVAIPVNIESNALVPNSSGVSNRARTIDVQNCIPWRIKKSAPLHNVADIAFIFFRHNNNQFYVFNLESFIIIDNVFFFCNR